MDAMASVCTVSGESRYDRTSAVAIPRARNSGATMTREIVRSDALSDFARFTGDMSV